MNEFFIAVIVAAVAIVLFTALRIYHKITVAKKNNDKLGILADKLMKKYLAEGVDIKYKGLSNENLMVEYRELLAQNEECIEERAENGVKCKLLEDEMTFRGINFQSIIDDVLKR